MAQKDKKDRRSVGLELSRTGHIVHKILHSQSERRQKLNTNNPGCKEGNGQELKPVTPEVRAEYDARKKEGPNASFGLRARKRSWSNRRLPMT